MSSWHDLVSHVRGKKRTKEKERHIYIYIYIYPSTNTIYYITNVGPKFIKYFNFAGGTSSIESKNPTYCLISLNPISPSNCPLI